MILLKTMLKISPTLVTKVSQRETNKNNTDDKYFLLLNERDSKANTEDSEYKLRLS